ncbi:5098_t:CDS:1, partial [Funneliformis geosporum]
WNGLDFRCNRRFNKSSYEEFKNALNTEHAAIWDGIATEINNHHSAQVT